MTAAPTIRAEIAFGTGVNPAAWALGASPFPTTLAPAEIAVWTDVTEDLRRLVVNRGKSRDLDQYQVGRCILDLDNMGRAYDPLNVVGPHVTVDDPMAEYLEAIGNLVGYWRLDETSGTNAVDSSSSGHDGTYVGSPTLDAADLDAEGNGAPDFNGTTQYVSGSDAALPSGATARSIVLRVNLDVVNVTDQPLFAYGTTFWSQAILIEANNAKVRVGKYGTNASASSGSIAASTDTTIAVTISASGDITYFLQGVPAGTATLAAINTVLNQFRIGDALAGWGLPSTANGRIGHVAVFSDVLTPAEVAAIHTRFTADHRETQVKPGRRTRLFATHPVTLLEYQIFQGVVRDWVVDYTGGFDARAQAQASDQIAELANTKVGITTSAGLSGTAVREILAAAGIAAADVDDGNSTLQAMTFSTSALTALRTLEQSEQGHLFVEHDGLVMFLQRHALLTEDRHHTSQATFGAGTLELATSPDIAYESDVIRNRVSITRAGGTEQVAADAGSIVEYGERAMAITGLASASDPAALGLAEYLLARLSEPAVRVRSIRIAPQSHDDLMTQALSRRLLDRVTVSFTPPGGTSPVSQEMFIIGIQHEWAPPQPWMTTFTFAPTELSVGWVLGVGALSDTTVLGY